MEDKVTEDKVTKAKSTSNKQQCLSLSLSIINQDEMKENEEGAPYI